MNRRQDLAQGWPGLARASLPRPGQASAWWFGSRRVDLLGLDAGQGRKKPLTRPKGRSEGRTQGRMSRAVQGAPGEASGVFPLRQGRS